MAAQETLEYLVRVNDRDLKELKRNIDTANHAMDTETGAAAAQADKHYRKVNAAALVAAGGVGIVLVKGLKDSVKAAIDAQRVQKATEVQLKALGISYGNHKKQIDSVITSTSKLAALDDEDLQQSFTRLLPATHNVNKALQEMQLAADVARARNISLESATNLVVRANTGSAGALRRLGISLVATNDHVAEARKRYADYKKAHDDISPAIEKSFRDQIAAAGAADKHAQAIKNINVLQKTFSGAAKTYGDSAAGAQERYHVALENLQEAIGNGLLPILTQLINVGSKLMDWASAHTGILKIMAGVVATLAVSYGAYTAVTKISTAVTSIAAGVQKLFAAEVEATNVAMEANPIGLVVAALVALGIGLVIAYKKSETFRDIVNGALHAVLTVATTVKDFVSIKIPAAFEAVVGWVRSNWPIIATLISGPFAPIVALATNAFGIRSALTGAMNGIKTHVSGVVDDVVGFWRALPGRIANALEVGYKGAIGMLKGAISKVFSFLPGFVKDILGIQSPSTVFAEIGKHIIGGAVVGIERAGPKLAAKAKDVFGSLAGVAKSLVGGFLNIFDDPSTVKQLKQMHDQAVKMLAAGPRPSQAGMGGPVSSSGLVAQVVNALGFARSHGWHGSVTSGFRSYAEQAALYQRYLHGGPLAAAPGRSSHEFGQAVDVTDYGTFGRLMGIAPAFERLYNHLGAADPVHWSVSGYDQGGYLPPGVTLAINKTGRPERVIAPHQESMMGGPLVHADTIVVREEADIDKVGSAVNRAWGTRSR